MSERIDKLVIWNTFSKHDGTFKAHKRADLIDMLSRSVVTYWITSGWIQEARTLSRGRVMVLTPTGKEHLIKTTAVWLSKRPSAMPECLHPHESFLQG